MGRDLKTLSSRGLYRGFLPYFLLSMNNNTFWLKGEAVLDESYDKVIENDAEK
jgi:hypothetical protein